MGNYYGDSRGVLMFVYHGMILLGLFMLPIVALLVYGIVKLLSKANKKQRILLTLVAIICVSVGIGWWLSIGTLTGAWQLHSDFNANPRHVHPAPLSIHFFGDGTGAKIDNNGYEQSFEWHITTHGELTMNTRFSSYIVRFRGFGTRLILEDSLRGERTMGRFDTRYDFRATYRRIFN